MVSCSECGAILSGQAHYCSRCGAEIQAGPDAGPIIVNPEAATGPLEASDHDPLACPRCNLVLDFAGVTQFSITLDREKSDEAVDVYLCMKCGRLQFFARGAAGSAR